MQKKFQFLAALCLSFSSLSSGLLADESRRVTIDDFILSRSPAVAPSASIDYTLNSEVDFDSVTGGLSFEQLELVAPLAPPIYFHDRHSLILALEYEATWLDTDTVMGDADLHDLRLSAFWLYKQLGSKWSWMLRVSPGIATDGEGIDSDDFVVSGQAIARYETSPKFAWMFGVVFSADPLETRVFPGVGFQWMPCDEVILRVNGPRIRASWQPCEDWLIRADIRPSGGAWNLDQGGNDLNVQLDVLEAGIGVERRIADKWWLGVWAGATFINELEIESTSGTNLFDEDAEVGWFTRIGIRRTFW